MSVALWVGLSLLAAAPEKTKVVVLQVRAFDASTEQRAGELQELALTELSRSKQLEVIGYSDIAAVLGVEKQKQILGCDEKSSSCLAEIGGALGAPYLVMGSVGRAGKLLRVDLKLVQASGARVLAREGQALESEDEWYPAVTRMLKGIAAAVPVSAPPESASGHVGPWVVLGAGAVAMVSGMVVMGQSAASAQAALDSKTASGVMVGDVSRAYDAAAGLHSVGVGVLAGGALMTAAGMTWFLLSQRESPAKVAVLPWVTPEGAAVSVAWRLP